MLIAKNMSLPATTKKIYLAGPDVFRLDAASYGDDLKKLCADAGFVGLYPLDKEAPGNLSPRETAGWIYGANVALIKEADLVMANLADFRAPGEPDSGTCWEVGHAVALGKPVFGYTRDRRMLAYRVPRYLQAGREGDEYLDEQGMLIEDFDLPMNLMLACSVRVVYGGPAECLAAIRAAVC